MPKKVTGGRLPSAALYAKAIGQLRTNTGMSMSEIAEAIGVSKPTIYRYANGLMQPDVDVWGRTVQVAKRRGQIEIVNLLLQPFSLALMPEGHLAA